MRATRSSSFSGSIPCGWNSDLNKIWNSYRGHNFCQFGFDSKADRSEVIQESTIASPGSELESARGTLWGAVNGVTHYVDHVARARTDSNRLFSGGFGDGERMKNSAVRVAAEMAGVEVMRTRTAGKHSPKLARASNQTRRQSHGESVT